MFKLELTLSILIWFYSIFGMYSLFTYFLRLVDGPGYHLVKARRMAIVWPIFVVYILLIMAIVILISPWIMLFVGKQALEYGED